jgi:hypothetical protein
VDAHERLPGTRFGGRDLLVHQLFRPTGGS